MEYRPADTKKTDPNPQTGTPRASAAATSSLPTKAADTRTLQERLEDSARNVFASLRLTKEDKLLIFVDDSKGEIADAFKTALIGKEIARFNIVGLDEWRKGDPLLGELEKVPILGGMPDGLWNFLNAAVNDIGYTAAIVASSFSTEEGEVAHDLRRMLLHSMEARVADLSNMTPDMMRALLGGNPSDVEALTGKVLAAVQPASKLIIGSVNGTKLTLELPAKEYPWEAQVPFIAGSKTWVQLPRARVFMPLGASALGINGTLVIDGTIGGVKTSKHGVLGKENAITVEIKSGRIRTISCKNPEIKKDFETDVERDIRSGKRIGLIAIGTNLHAQRLTGNMGIDMHAPCFQIVFGNPSWGETNAPWEPSESGVPVTILRPTVQAGFKTVLDAGVFASDLLK
ncbi:Uncharacterised protein [Candidatus Burarchaeum australiense]|nr:Uncharacterised protein [Candidatus Burarchaeum australiense]